MTTSLDETRVVGSSREGGTSGEFWRRSMVPSLKTLRRVGIYMVTSFMLAAVAAVVVVEPIARTKKPES